MELDLRMYSIQLAISPRKRLISKMLWVTKISYKCYHSTFKVNPTDSIMVWHRLIYRDLDFAFVHRHSVLCYFACWYIQCCLWGPIFHMALGFDRAQEFWQEQGHFEAENSKLPMTYTETWVQVSIRFTHTDIHFVQ